MKIFLSDRRKHLCSRKRLCSKFITEREYTTYFVIQQVLSELVEDQYISSESTLSQTLYRITPEGKEALSCFYKKISKEIRDDIDTYLTNEKYTLREEVSSLADYYETGSGEYIAELKIIERDSSIIELSLLVPTASAAETICTKWKQKNADIYAYVLNTLLEEDKAES